LYPETETNRIYNLLVL